MNLVIRAGAGTGKTRRLAVEYVKLLLRIGRECDYRDSGLFSQILVLTFTRKATAEIGERIRRFLTVLSEPNDCEQESLRKSLEADIQIRDDRERAYLGRVLNEMCGQPQRMNVNTIDSFTQSIFRGMVAPLLQIGDYELDTASDQKAHDETLTRVLSDAESFRALASIFRRYAGKARELTKYRAFVQNIVTMRSVITEMSTVAPSKPTQAWLDEYLALALPFLEKIIVLDEAKWDKHFKGDFLKAMRAVGLEPGNVRERLPIVLNDSLLREQSQCLSASAMLQKRFADKNPDLVGEYNDRIYPLLIAAAATEARTVSAEICSLSRHVLAHYDEVRRDAKRYNHKDIESLTARFLRDCHDEATGMVYEILATRIRYVLLDEFQDTSVEQWRMLLPILQEAASGQGMHLDSGFVLVGDEKQAIYNWRGGERGLLSAADKSFPTGVQIDYLNSSWRSLPAVVEFVNEVFGRAKGLFPELNWEYTPLESKRSDGKGLVSVVTDNYTSGGERKKTDCLRDFVDKFLLPRLEELGPHAEIGVLARTNSEIAAIAARLSQKGIRFALDTARSLCEHAAVRPLLAILRWKAWGRALDLLTFIRSAYVGLDKQTFRKVLDRFREISREEFAPDFPRRWLTGNERLEDICTRLEAVSAAEGIFTTLETVLREFGVQERFPREIDFRNLERLLETADAYSEQTDYPGFLDFLERSQKSLSQVGSGSTGRLTLLTIHKAKGLEYENLFTFLNFTNRSGTSYEKMAVGLWSRYDETFTELQDALLIPPGMGGILKNIPGSTPESAGIELLREGDARSTLSEALNNLYVALTRARDRLFVYALTEASEKTLGELGNSEEGRIRSLYTLLTPFNRVIMGESTPTLARDAVETSPATPPAIAWEKGRQQLPEILPISTDQWSHLVAEHTTNARLIGSLAHDFLAAMTYADEHDIIRARNTVISRYGTLLPPDRMLAACTILVDWMRSNPEYFSRKWDRVMTEFSVFDGEQERRIDRLLIDSTQKHVLIVDFKTGSVDTPWQQETYPRLVNGLLGEESGYRVEFVYASLTDVGRQLRETFNKR